MGLYPEENGETFKGFKPRLTCQICNMTRLKKRPVTAKVDYGLGESKANLEITLIIQKRGMGRRLQISPNSRGEKYILEDRIQQ